MVNLLGMFCIAELEFRGSNVTLNPGGDQAVPVVCAKSAIFFDIFGLLVFWIQTLAYFTVRSIAFAAAIAPVPIAATIIVLIVAISVLRQIFVFALTVGGTIRFGTRFAQKTKPRTPWVAVELVSVVK